MNKKDKRIEMRITDKVLSVIDQAAELQGINRTSFIINAAVTKATQVISANQNNVLIKQEIENTLTLKFEEYKNGK